MRWRWRTDRDEDQAEPHQGRPDEARTARREAERSLAAAEAQWGPVRQVAAALKAVREQNHFAETVAETMRRRGDV